MDKKLLTILACPLCKGELFYNKDAEELICYPDSLAFLSAMKFLSCWKTKPGH